MDWMYAFDHFKDFSLIFFTELNVNLYPHLKHRTFSKHLKFFNEIIIIEKIF